MSTNFFWFSGERIAGMERPGTYRALEEDIAFLKDKGIEIVISLTLDSLQREASAMCDFEFFHIPVADGAAPTIPQIEKFINYVNYGLSSGKKIVVHCGAGYGRTGTMLACHLVSLGCPASRAITEVRRKRPRAVENRMQEECVSSYERYLKEKKSAPPGGRQ